MPETPGRAVVEAHLTARYLPPSLAPAVEATLGLLLRHGWKIAEDMLVYPAEPRLEAAVGTTADGGQLIRVIDAVNALQLLPLLPERISWVQRHPAWQHLFR